MKPGALNVGHDHLSRLEIGEDPTSLHDALTNAKLFAVKMVDDHYANIYVSWTH